MRPAIRSAIRGAITGQVSQGQAEVYTINFAAQSDRVNTSINTITPTGLTVTKTLLIKRDGAGATDATYRMIVPDGIPSGTSGIASSQTDGGITGLPVGYAGSLLCAQVVTDKVFVAAAFTIDHEFSDLEPNAEYSVVFVGSRVAGDARTTRLTDLATDDFIELSTSSDPATLSPPLSVMTDSEGSFTLRQSAAVGTFSYINGIQAARV